jgi:hypothetical protein
VSSAGSPTRAAPASGQAPIRAAEVVGAVSLATDLGTGQPLEHTLTKAILAVRLGELAGASPLELADAYYVALLHSFGCTSDGPEATELYGDDIAPRAAFALVDAGNLEEVGAFLTAMVGGGRAADVREAMVGAEKRKQHGSKGATVFRDPNEDDRVWVLFDWDADGWQSFVSDPEVPPILQEAGHKGKPQAAELGGRYDA